MSDAFRSQLRALPDFPPDLPDFDPATAPSDPAELFKQWLDEALAAGVLQPHACSLATADGNGQPSARMLILKNIDDDGWHFATSRTSRKGLELAANPHAALNFYWPQQGRWWSCPQKPQPLTGRRARQLTAATTRTGSCTPSVPRKLNSGRPATTGGTSGTATAPKACRAPGSETQPPLG